MTSTKEKSKPKKSRGEYAAPALSKGLDILEMMAAESEGLNLGEIAERLNRSKGEIFRMLAVLEQRNYIRTEPRSDTYSLTLKLFEIAHQTTRIELLTNAAIPVMRNLAKIADQSCHLVIPSDAQGLVIAQQDNLGDRHFGVRLGSVVPLIDSCSGHIILAYSDDDVRDEILAKKSIKSKKTLSKAHLTTLTRRIRSQGFEKIKSIQIQGVVDIGYPIFDYSGHLIGALVIPYIEYLNSAPKLNIKATQEQLRIAALAISDALGYKAAGSARM